ncbi:acyltransferase family protein [Actinomadura nitritigenes]|uniref:Acyltransferase family protein n=1 Tax=Actinomadura nitritigenes TaxID=134602 RepID=A0ABS3R1L5_9ACTN|nr:acyltransferase family protein [Actinomadura nitritigenes]MBO2439907.1 acyltransferase family protein [Actinomadura nitritigenes]
MTYSSRPSEAETGPQAAARAAADQRTPDDQRAPAVPDPRPDPAAPAAAGAGAGPLGAAAATATVTAPVTEAAAGPVTGAPDGERQAAGPVRISSPPKPRKERDPYFDNAKYFAILLVVSGHSIANLQNVPMAKCLYIFIYMFHMPLFIVITGYFSRNWTFSPGKARKLITNVGVPYVVFEVAYSLYDWLAGRHDLEISLLSPYYLTWFLCALFLWRLSTPVWQQIRWPLAVAMGFALLSYMSDLGSTFDIHRVFGLLPFYVLGLKLRPEHFELLKRPIARPIGAVVLVIGLACSYVVMKHMSVSWIFWKDPHFKLGVGDFKGTLMRLAMFASATVLVAAFLTLIPRRRYWFTALGSTTLYCYLLHGFVTRLLNFTGWWGADWMHTPGGVVAVICGAVVVGTFLCSPPVRRTMSWALEPKMTWVFTPLRRPSRG